MIRGDMVKRSHEQTDIKANPGMSANYATIPGNPTHSVSQCLLCPRCLLSYGHTHPQKIYLGSLYTHTDVYESENNED